MDTPALKHIFQDAEISCEVTLDNNIVLTAMGAKCQTSAGSMFYLRRIQFDEVVKTVALNEHFVPVELVAHAICASVAPQYVVPLFEWSNDKYGWWMAHGMCENMDPLYHENEMWQTIEVLTRVQLALDVAQTGLILNGDDIVFGRDAHGSMKLLSFGGRSVLNSAPLNPGWLECVRCRSVTNIGSEVDFATSHGAVMSPPPATLKRQCSQVWDPTTLFVEGVKEMLRGALSFVADSWINYPRDIPDRMRRARAVPAPSESEQSEQSEPSEPSESVRVVAVNSAVLMPICEPVDPRFSTQTNHMVLKICRYAVTPGDVAMVLGLLDDGEVKTVSSYVDQQVQTQLRQQAMSQPAMPLEQKIAHHSLPLSEPFNPDLFWATGDTDTDTPAVEQVEQLEQLEQLERVEQLEQQQAFSNPTYLSTSEMSYYEPPQLPDWVPEWEPYTDEVFDLAFEETVDDDITFLSRSELDFDYSEDVITYYDDLSQPRVKDPILLEMMGLSLDDD
uniref:Protein ORF85 n=1 Tax=Anguillid herpesvirus 1 TaxID=150286 RepID=A0A8E5EVI2_9VIRU|nr:protein ORF85 [Anguillid herpesvirus 1]